jgi:hypothetical protein
MRFLTTVLVALAVGAAAACASSPSQDGIATAGGATPSRSAGPGGAFDADKWIKCLRQQGLTVDDPAPGEEKPHIHDELASPEQIRTAAEKCREFNPNFGQPRPPMTVAEQEQYRRFAQCMRDRGIDMPDDPGPAAPPTAPGGGRTVSGQDFERALKECADLVPGVATTEFPGGKS